MVLCNEPNPSRGFNRKILQIVPMIDELDFPILPGLNQIQAAVVSAYPNSTLTVLKNTVHFVFTQTIQVGRVVAELFGLVRLAASMKQHDACTLGSHPNVALSVLHHAIDCSRQQHIRVDAPVKGNSSNQMPVVVVSIQSVVLGRNP